MKSISIASVWAAFLLGGTPLVVAEVILFEDFEDAIVTYGTNVPDDVSSVSFLDYHGRIAPDTVGALPSNLNFSSLQGSGFFGAQDTDALNGVDTIILDWVGIDVSEFENLNLSWLVAEDDSNDAAQDWDANSSLRLEAQLDGGGFVEVFAIEAAAGGNNQTPRVDTDFDGIGDGAEITDAFAQFDSVIGNGATLDLRLILDFLDQGDEDIAFDSLQLTGDRPAEVPEPSVSLLIAVSVGGLVWRRRRT